MLNSFTTKLIKQGRREKKAKKVFPFVYFQTLPPNNSNTHLLHQLSFVKEILAQSAKIFEKFHINHSTRNLHTHVNWRWNVEQY